MDFLELWKRFPVLWHQSHTPRDTIYASSVNELTKQINRKSNLTLTKAGMILTLNRIRKWFRRHATNDENSLEGKSIKREYDNVKRDYYEKCSEFLPKNETRTLACNKCPSFFCNEEQLQEHNVKRHKQYCELCQKDYGSTQAYRKHVFIHLPPKHKCEICAKEYIRHSCYEEHMRAHRNERNFVCEKCGKKFVRKKNLRDHTKLRHPDKDNHLKRQPCAICDIDFKDWGALCRHRRRHHMVLEGTIEELTSGIKCGVREKRKHTFIIDPITKQRRTVCEVCGNTYAHYGGLYTHMVNAHGFVRPGQRLKEAQQNYSRILKINTETLLGEAANREDHQHSDEMNVENIAEDNDDFDDDDELKFFSEDHDFENDSEGVDYEFIVEELDKEK